MTMISRLGFKPTQQSKIRSSILTSSKEITIIIPVKNNQKGIDLFLDVFFKTHTGNQLPREIIIVDNNSQPPIELQPNFPISVKLLRCTKIGPASARNHGLKNATTEWILFTDSDCVPTTNTLSGYFNTQNGSLGYAGNIKALGNDVISKYYEQQEILVPPKVYETPDEPRPDYLITANCLVWRSALETIGGFNETINLAGGEDIDLGFRLRNIGQLSYAFDSIMYHDFGNGLFAFRERFIRYGHGNKIISRLYDLDLTPRIFKPNKRTPLHYLLSFLQYVWLTKGYKSNTKTKTPNTRRY